MPRWRRVARLGGKKVIPHYSILTWSRKLIEIRVYLAKAQARDGLTHIVLLQARFGLVEILRFDAVCKREVCFTKGSKMINRLNKFAVSRIVPVLIVSGTYLVTCLFLQDTVERHNALELDLGEHPHLFVPVFLDEAVDLFLHALPLIFLDKAVEAANRFFYRMDNIPRQHLWEIMEESGKIVVVASPGASLYFEREEIRQDGDDEHMAEHRRFRHPPQVAPPELEA